MDSPFSGLFGLESGSVGFSGSSDDFADTSNSFRFRDLDIGLDFNLLDNPFVVPDLDPSNSALSSATSGDEDSPSDDNDFSENILNYISEMLMEEDMEVKPCMFHDPLALQAAERSFYDVLGESYPPSTVQNSCHDNGFSGSLSDYSSNGSISAEHLGNREFREGRSSFMKMPIPSNFVFQSSSQSGSLLNQRNSVASNGSIPGGSTVKTAAHPASVVVPNVLNETELAFQFKRGVEEASKFLPKEKKLVIDLETNSSNFDLKGNSPRLVKEEKYDAEYTHNWFPVKKNHNREDVDYEDERCYKQSAVYLDESELADMFDKTLVCVDETCRLCILDEAPQSESAQQRGEAKGSNGTKARPKRETSNREIVDLRTLLIQCAQAVSANNLRAANELLKKIRRHSSPFGDASQRLAHCFANGLEARLAGTGTPIYANLSAVKPSAADMLKAYQAYVSICPFNQIALIFANHNISMLAKKAKTLHIIDFGIFYGFQWPPLIYRLSRRPGGPPKLRITGIELPQSGLRPAERVRDTGRRLEKYCKLHNVPFEYNAIAQKWETIKIDDLKIKSNEFVAVNCMFRFKNLLDETVAVNSPRNAVLKLIRKANPDFFVQAIVNGSYNLPFFVSRFREALYHFSSLFDICDTTMGREDQMRLKYEKEFYGREVVNVLACEGSERVERPEMYKQWQVRNTRAGFKPLPLDPLLMKKLKGKVKADYHRDFMVGQDGNWMLQGWKGRVMYASSAWVPSQK